MQEADVDPELQSFPGSPSLKRSEFKPFNTNPNRNVFCYFVVFTMLELLIIKKVQKVVKSACVILYKVSKICCFFTFLVKLGTKEPQDNRNVG